MFSCIQRYRTEYGRSIRYLAPGAVKPPFLLFRHGTARVEAFEGFLGGVLLHKVGGIVCTAGGRCAARDDAVGFFLYGSPPLLAEMGKVESA